MPRFVVCVPTSGAPSLAPCADVDGVAHYPVVMSFPAPGEVHFANADTLFAYGFTAVITIWLLGLAVGLILSVVHRGR